MTTAAAVPRTEVPAVPAPGEPPARPRRERPRDQYWDVFDARWRTFRR